MLHRAHVSLHEEAILTRDAMALDDLRAGSGQLAHALQLTSGRPNADHRAEGIAQCSRIDIGAIAPDHALALEALQALGDRRRREADAPAELGPAETGVVLERLEQFPVRLIEGSVIGEMAIIPLIRRHAAELTVESRWTIHPGLRENGGVQTQRLPPHVYFVVSAVFHYLGPSCAVLLFARVDALGVAWLRIASAALIFAAWRRPWSAFASLDGSGRRLLLAWGCVLALMNCCFYLAISREPLAMVAAIEFLPVVALAALGLRNRRNVAALALAVAGVSLATSLHLALEPLGVAFAFANAVLFALYIVLADRVAKRSAPSGLDGLAAAMLIAAAVVTPLAGWAAIPALGDPAALAAGVGVGVSSSVIPYVTDQLALARLARATYALMVSLLPAFATVIGVLVLTQIPSGTEIAGVFLVIAGVALHRVEPPNIVALDKESRCSRQVARDVDQAVGHAR
ncbi:MAG: inner rane transporter RhtA [Gaiellales bacterium]|nr:inner rane transporter RhtA [Gaiellales bacterium]